ncbi:HPr family phosphocarrier protein [candidate division TA06 bacterium]|uniref:HPr family phosphocarrier protein n=2 Tax=candidate division TA06 bacterium TaxID=2250710 RepID=A0A523UTD6_UNCT6|nr:MAG: HPr family phosphocarrier protein [candidate division TA06 bacterium]
MTERKVKIINKLGLHARPAAMLVKTAGKYKSEVTLSKDDMEVNAKSIMGVMMLAAEKGSIVTIRAEGEDEAEVVDALVGLVERKFDED